ncbi:hypothetical protein HK101_002504 [Irineochytrium annulatum]|nr:hypothetical protein HK101_002504 [Irineochytrium annulatum]
MTLSPASTISSPDTGDLDHLEQLNAQFTISQHILDASPRSRLQRNEYRARHAVAQAICTSQLLGKRYKISHILGFGSNGVILAARPAGKRDRVAIKMIYKTGRWKDGAIPSEVGVLDYLSTTHPHPNIIQLNAAWEDENFNYVVTDLHDASGGNAPSASTDTPDLVFLNTRTGLHERIPFRQSRDLWTWLNDHVVDANKTSSPISFQLPHIPFPMRPPPMDSVRCIFAQVADAVRHLHDLGIAHLDIKEENVLLSTRDDGGLHAKLADFGHAVDAWAGPVWGCGTEEYCAPELHANLASHRRPSFGHDDDGVPRSMSSPGAETSSRRTTLGAAPPCDIFALGLLLYSLLHGPNVFPQVVLGTTSMGWDIREMDLGESGCEYPLDDREVRPDAEADCVDLLRGMLRVDPGRRFTAREVVGHRWISDLVGVRGAKERW